MPIDPKRGRRALAAALLAALLAAPALAAEATKARPTPTPKPRPTTTPQHPAAGKDGMVAVPAGKFFRGCNEEVDVECLPDEKPGRYEELAAFRIDVKEVTVAQYARCVAEKQCTTDGLTTAFHGGKEQPEYSEFCNWGKQGRDKHPINCVTWKQADAFCTWAGKRLPTEAEWEFASRGGLDSQPYVWGSDPPSASHPQANLWEGRFPSSNSKEDGWVRTAPVKSYKANGYGLYDMSGNVWEWCSDWYDKAEYRRRADTDVVENPPGPSKSFDPNQPFTPLRSQRGGSFLCNDAYCTRYRPSARHGCSPDTGMSHVGFRCVKSPEAK